MIKHHPFVAFDYYCSLPRQHRNMPNLLSPIHHFSLSEHLKSTEVEQNCCSLPSQFPSVKQKESLNKQTWTCGRKSQRTLISRCLRLSFGKKLPRFAQFRRIQKHGCGKHSFSCSSGSPKLDIRNANMINFSWFCKTWYFSCFEVRLQHHAVQIPS